MSGQRLWILGPYSPFKRNISIEQTFYQTRLGSERAGFGQTGTRTKISDST